MNGNTWILIADSAEAHIYRTHKAKLFLPEANEKDLNLVKKYTHHESQKQVSKVVSDSSGRYRSSGYGSDTFDTPTDPKQYEENRFALQLFKILHHAYRNKEFAELILIAPPSFMGMLNKHIHTDEILQKSIQLKIEKNYIHLQGRELIKQMQTHL